MTGREIREKSFDKAAMFGYKTDEVDLFRSEVAQVVDNLIKEKAVLEKKIEILAGKIAEYRKDEDSMKEALLGAQRLGNTVVAEAQEKADKLIAQAQEKADAMMREAEKNASKSVGSIKVQVEKEQQTLVKMQKEVSNFKARLLSIYKSHLDLITALPELEIPEEQKPVAKELTEENAPQEAVKAEEPVAVELETAESSVAGPAVEEIKQEEKVVDPVERAKKELENTQQIAKKQLNAVNGDLEKTQQISFGNAAQRISFKSERVDMEKNFESKFGDLKFGKNNKSNQ